MCWFESTEVLIIKAYRVRVQFRDELTPSYVSKRYPGYTGTEKFAHTLHLSSEELTSQLEEARNFWGKHCDEPIVIEEYDATELVNQKIKALDEEWAVLIENRNRLYALFETHTQGDRCSS